METTKEATKTTLKPLGNRVLAKRLDQEERWDHPPRFC